VVKIKFILFTETEEVIGDTFVSVQGTQYKHIVCIIRFLKNNYYCSSFIIFILNLSRRQVLRITSYDVVPSCGKKEATDVTSLA